MKYYTGIGSRSTPPKICSLMTEIATSLEMHGYILRSGGATGADVAFESGVKHQKNKEIWVPWIGFNNNASSLLPSDDAFHMAQNIHPIWNNLPKSVKSLHARNCHQVLGHDLNTPSKFVLCYTENAELKGGTATALKIALNNSIPILNFGKWKKLESMYEALKDFLLLIGEQHEI